MLNFGLLLCTLFLKYVHTYVPSIYTSINCRKMKGQMQSTNCTSYNLNSLPFSFPQQFINYYIQHEIFFVGLSLQSWGTSCRLLICPVHMLAAISALTEIVLLLVDKD